jgi:transcriptional regulator of acetoin/glycerol metabolism
MSAIAVRELWRYEWPGNVRELRNVIARVVALAHDSMIGCDDVRSAMAYGHTTGLGDRQLDDDDLRAREALAASLQDAGGATDAVARQLGVSRSTVYRRMDRLGIDVKPALRRPNIDDPPTSAMQLSTQGSLRSVP